MLAARPRDFLARSFVGARARSCDTRRKPANRAVPIPESAAHPAVYNPFFQPADGKRGGGPRLLAKGKKRERKKEKKERKGGKKRRGADNTERRMKEDGAGEGGRGKEKRREERVESGTRT